MSEQTKPEERKVVKRFTLPELAAIGNALAAGEFCDDCKKMLKEKAEERKK